MSAGRVQGWDPILIICQIISLQSLHYLTLALFLPPLLSAFTSPNFLIHEGGPATVSIIMDWREIAGQPTFSLPASTPSSAGWMDMFGGAWSGGKLVGVGAAGSAGGLYDESDGSNEFVRDWVHEWDGQADSKRGWVIAGAWGIASCVDVLFLHHFVRRPTHILDHAASFTFNHILLTIYYSAHFPSSIFFWIVMTTCTVGTIVWAEQVCVAREMREGIGDWSGNLDVEQQQAFMGDRNHRNEGDEELEMIGIGEDRR